MRLIRYFGCLSITLLVLACIGVAAFGALAAATSGDDSYGEMAAACFGLAVVALVGSAITIMIELEVED